MSSSAPLICIAGPTASGKSAISRLISEHLPVEIINVDSATIYRTMDIGTAKPSFDERSSITHHLLDIRDPSESYSAAQFREDALACIDQIRSRARIPLLVGGTMLYFKILRDGIDDLPPANPELRASILQKAQLVGWPAMHEDLRKVDPQTANRLAINDSQRIGRALEVYLSTGQPLSSFLTWSGKNQPPREELTIISLEPSDRSVLHSRIESRFDQMLEQGLAHEVSELFARKDLDPSLPAIRCVGYRQMWEFIAGEISLPEAREKAIAATRQLAKRQLTWLRSMPERHVIDCLSDAVEQQVLAFVQATLKQR